MGNFKELYEEIKNISRTPKEFRYNLDDVSKFLKTGEVGHLGLKLRGFLRQYFKEKQLKEK